MLGSFIFGHLLPVLGNCAKVGLHLRSLSLQRDHLVDDEVGVLDLLEFSSSQNWEFLCGPVLDGVEAELAGLQNKQEQL